MPTYEYICSKCDQTFEIFQSITEKPLAVCPKNLCQQKRWGKGKIKRAIGGGAGLIFKGSGFYITDYRSDKYKEAAKKDAPPSSDAKSSASGSTPGKSETKSATPAPKTGDTK